MNSSKHCMGWWVLGKRRAGSFTVACLRCGLLASRGCVWRVVMALAGPDWPLWALPNPLHISACW